MEVGKTLLVVGKKLEKLMECDGRSLSVEEYPELFEVLGNQHGGDGVNNFNLPTLPNQGPFKRVIVVKP